MNSTQKPWEICSELTEERLTIIGETLKKARDEAVMLYDSDAGDGAWSLGCRVYERSMNQVEALAQKHDWLKIYRDNLYFIMLLGETPIKFHRGILTEPAIRSLRRLGPERHFQQRPLGPGFEPSLVWRIVIETEFDYRVFRIILAQYDSDGNCFFNWEIPLFHSPSVLSAVDALRHDAIELEKPSIRRKSELENVDVSLSRT